MTRTRSRQWSVTVNYDAKGEVTWELLDAIAAMGGAAAGMPGRRRVDTTMTIRAVDPMDAVRQAILKMSAVCKGDVAAIEVATTEEFDRRLGEPSFPELVGVAEIAQMFGVNRARASALQRINSFPLPVAVLACGPVWRKGDISGFAETWDRRSGRKPPASKTEKKS
jgi:hypothetical protein